MEKNDGVAHDEDFVDHQTPMDPNYCRSENQIPAGHQAVDVDLVEEVNESKPADAAGPATMPGKEGWIRRERVTSCEAGDSFSTNK